jgi:D-psicose/D-tagatose/L-ribulose 3-epimerase
MNAARSAEVGNKEMLIGCHGLVFTGVFDQAGVDTCARMTAEAGYNLLELPLLDPYSFDIAAAKKSLAPYDLQISSSMGHSLDSDISSEDPDAVKAGEAKLNKILEILHELESGYLAGVIYSALNKYMQPATQKGRQNSMDVLRRVADRAQTLGIQLGLEIVNRYETNIMNTARQGLAYLEELDHQNVGIHLDTYHMNIEESDMVQPVLDCGDKLVYVHIGESHRGYLGSGNVDFDNFFKALDRIGYQGPMTFESFSSAVVSPQLSSMLGIWRNLWDDSGDLSKHAYHFMQGKRRAAETISMH